jgi:RNA polymerase sigma-70 factor (ECF subfamily)
LQSLEEIYRQYANRVYNIALNHLRNVEDAEEVVQDVFLAVHEKAIQFEGKSTLGTWIYRIAVNRSLDKLKSRSAQKRGWGVLQYFDVFTQWVPQQNTEFNHPGVALEYKETLQQWFGWIDQLPEKQRTALILVRLEGLEISEVAQIMNISVKAVDALLSRARKKLLKFSQKSEGK